MKPSSRFTLFSLLMAFVLVFSLVAPTVAFADDGTPEEPTPTVEPSEPAADEAAAETATEEVATEEVAAEEDASEETASEVVAVEETLAEIVVALDEAEAVLVDAEGEPLALASEEAVEALANPDPYYVDGGVTHRFLADCSGQPFDAFNTCTVSATPIQAAINAAPSGAEIYVEAGTFNESPTVNKTLTLKGANAGIDPNTGTRSAESIINGLLTISADSVTIDGFTITNPNGNYGISAGGNDNLVIVNNIVTDVGNNVGGTSANNYGILVQPGSSSADGITITNNLVDTVEAPRGSGGIGVIGSTGTGAVTNVTISNNVVLNIVAFKGGSSGGAYGIHINHGANSTGSVAAPQILNNTIANLDGKWAHGIGLESDTANALVQGNAIDNVDGSVFEGASIMVEANDGASSVTISGNDFTNADFGVVNVTALTVNAAGNYWGCAGGPGASGCVGVAGAVTTDPFLVLSAFAVDTDGDLIVDAADNCPAAANADQNDSDDDGLGNVCDRFPQDPTNEGPGAPLTTVITGGGFIPVTGGQTLTLDMSPEDLLAALGEFANDQFPLEAVDGQYSFACVLESVTTLTEDTYITVGDQVVTSVGQCSYLVDGEVQTMTIALSFLGATQTFAPGSVMTVGLLEDDATASFAGSGNPFDVNNFLVASSLGSTGNVTD